LLLFILLAAAPLKAEAKRVVSLMPSYTEIIFGLGAGKDLVGVSNFCNWPPETAKLEKTGDYMRPNLEKVYSLKPDTVFAGAWADASSSKQLSSMGIKVVSLPEEKSAAGIFATVRLIAAELGRKREGEKLVRKLTALMPVKLPEKPLKVYLEADTGGWPAAGISSRRRSAATSRPPGKRCCCSTPRPSYFFPARRRNSWRARWRRGWPRPGPGASSRGWTGTLSRGPGPGFSPR